MLESNKDAYIADRITQIESVTCGNWSWIRPPTGRALNELLDINNIISSVTLSDRPDAWKYAHDPSGIYTTKSLAQVINSLKLGQHASNISVMHNKYIPQKVHIFAWRVVQKKLPVRVELDKRGIDLDTILCPLCNIDIETSDHIMVLCLKVSQIWSLILNWWNLHNSSITNIEDAVINKQPFTSKNIGSYLWQATKWTVCYTTWKHRNLKVFSKKEWNPVTP
ncbi:uncharacterized protein [Rutidosis leptorrhynchoides]|uniref:uncharacterized protein n=1 Tax=Rutidosis leptorrhynchoides TaxID=125765 RepID=UPI003A99BCF5